MSDSLLVNIENFVKELFQNKIKYSLYFHNFDHTYQVVKYAELIGINSGCKKEELKLLKIAAWFHDTGFSKTYEGHEQVSAEIAEKFLNSKSFPKKNIEEIKKLILATQIKFVPETLCEKVICDADLAHLGTELCPNRQKALRDELEEVLEFSYTDNEWLKINIGFMKNHKYYTEYAMTNFGNKKVINLKNLESKLISEK